MKDKKWTKRYHDPNPNKKCFGGRVVIKMKNGEKIVDEISVADAHPAGNRPFERENYIEKISDFNQWNYFTKRVSKIFESSSKP